MQTQVDTKKRFLNEIVWIRAISCLAVVAIHAVSWHGARFEYGTNPTDEQLPYVLLTLVFGTPLFIMISEILSARSNPLGDRPGFLSNRFKYIGIPYVSMIVVYAIIDSQFGMSDRSFTTALIVNIAGLFNPYYLLIILQFAVLHQLFARFLDKIRPVKAIAWSLGLTILYLLPFNLLAPPSDNAVIHYLWHTYYFYVFPAWLVYFVIGYYLGRHYDAVVSFIRRHHAAFVASPLLGLAFLWLNQWFGIVATPNSKRYDNILYAFLAAACIVALSGSFKQVPVFLDKISQHSFGIYLIHAPVLLILKDFIYPPAFSNGLISIPIVFVIALGGAYALTHVMNRIPFGHFIVGRLTPAANPR